MDQVTKIKRDLEKTVTKNDVKSAVTLLRSLESISMTLEILQSTHIGKTVNKIRKGIDDNEVASLSKSMVRKWKKLINSDNINSATNETNPSNEKSMDDGDTGNLDQHNNKKPAPVQASPTTRVESPTPASRSAPIQTQVPPTNCEIRLKCRELLCNALKKPISKDSVDETLMEEEILAGRIEECIFQEFKFTDPKYRNRVRSRVSNLGDIKNPFLRYNVLRGYISPERIAKMTADEMASDELKKEREKFTKEAINDHQMALTTGTKTSEIKCPACKKYNVTYNQVQTRSADEPMTTFCYCNDCGKRWKFC